MLMVSVPLLKRWSFLNSLDDSSNSCPSMDSSPPVLSSNQPSSSSPLTPLTQYTASAVPVPAVTQASLVQPSSVFSFRAARLLGDSLDSVPLSTASHSSEASDSTENGDAMVTDDSGCDTREPLGELMEEGSKATAAPEKQMSWNWHAITALKTESWLELSLPPFICRSSIVFKSY